MKKIALCLHGQPRALGKAIEYLRPNLLDREDISVDIFIHTWNYADWFPGINEEIVSIYKPKAIRIDPPLPKTLASKYKDPNPPRFMAYSNFSHFNSIWRCEELKHQFEVDNGFAYDWVIKTRFDLALNFKLDFSSMDESCLYISDFDLDFYKNNSRRINSDAFIVGNSRNARIYSSVIKHIDELCEKNGTIDGHGMFGILLDESGLVNSLRGLNMNHPFHPNGSDCMPNSFIRCDFNSFHGK